MANLLTSTVVDTVPSRRPAISSSAYLDVFGGSKKWNTKDWTASDDRVRGGASQSYLDIVTSISTTTMKSTEAVRFSGTLDIETLGGAGFASQRTVFGDDDTQEKWDGWDLSGYDGLVVDVDVKQSDQKKYVFILKDNLPGKDSETGREKAAISWEAEFDVGSKKKKADANYPSGGSYRDDPNVTFEFEWKDFEATYRGRKKKDAEPLDKANVKRMSLMMRSFFGEQKGEFELVVKRISAFRRGSSGINPERVPSRLWDEKKASADEEEEDDDENQGWVKWALEQCTRSVRLM